MCPDKILFSTYRNYDILSVGPFIPTQKHSRGRQRAGSPCSCILEAACLPKASHSVSRNCQRQAVKGTHFSPRGCFQAYVERQVPCLQCSAEPRLLLVYTGYPSFQTLSVDQLTSRAQKATETPSRVTQLMTVLPSM